MAKTRWYVYMICSYYLCERLLELYKSTFSPSFNHLFWQFLSFSFLQLTTFPHFPFSFSSFPVSTPLSHFLFSPISFLLVPSLCHISLFPFCFFCFSQFTPFFLSVFLSYFLCLLPSSQQPPHTIMSYFLGIIFKSTVQLSFKQNLFLKFLKNSEFPYLSGLSKVTGCRRKSPPTWLVSAGYSAWHFFMDVVF